MTPLEKIELAHGFSRGSYANAYETECFETALKAVEEEERSAAYRAAFTLGFFGSHSLAEIPGSCREAFDEAYWSECGQAVVELGYSDSRSLDYEKEGS